jgi:hypothetical protein
VREVRREPRLELGGATGGFQAEVVIASVLGGASLNNITPRPEKPGATADGHSGKKPQPECRVEKLPYPV